MVMIWNQLAGGDNELCAILVIINSLLQIVLYSPMSVFFINVIGRAGEGEGIRLEYGKTAIAVLIVRYLGVTIHADVCSTLVFPLLLALLRDSSSSP